MDAGQPVVSGSHMRCHAWHTYTCCDSNPTQSSISTRLVHEEPGRAKTTCRALYRTHQQGQSEKNSVQSTTRAYAIWPPPEFISCGYLVRRYRHTILADLVRVCCNGSLRLASSSPCKHVTRLASARERASPFHVRDHIIIIPAV